jgi:hypothetical protein
LALGCCRIASTQPAGFIDGVKGKCYVLRDTVNRTPRSPTAALGKKPAEVGASLLAGDRVRCDEGGRLDLELREGSKSISTSKPDTWTTISEAAPRRDAAARPSDDYFKLGGATRGGLLTWVYSPPGGSEDGAVWPSHFVIRWIPPETPGRISLAVHDATGKQLWPRGSNRQVAVVGATGELIAPELRDVLLEYQRSGSQAKLTLVLANPDGDESSVQFSVISSADEDALQRQMNDCTREDGLMRFICPAYYLRQHHLYTEAAEEYEDALKAFAPASVELMQHAIAAHGLTGNSKREKELTKILADRAKTPE